MDTMATRIEQERKRLKLKKKSLAEKIFISERALGDITNGKTAQPELETMIRLSETLGCSLDFLTGASNYKTMNEITGLDADGLESLRRINKLNPERVDLLNRMASSGLLNRLLETIWIFCLICDSSTMTLTNDVYKIEPVSFDRGSVKTQLRTSAMFEFGKLLDETAELYENDRLQAASDRIAILESQAKISETEKQIMEKEKTAD